MSQLSSGTPYDVFRAGDLAGGKRVAVFTDADGDLQARAAQAGAPLSVFVVQAGAAGLHLRVFTPEREKGESDSASVAALVHYQGQLADMAEVRTGKSATSAQLCGGEWLLRQGAVRVQASEQPHFPGTKHTHISQIDRPNLVLELDSLAALDSYLPEAARISELGRATNTTGLILYTLEKPASGPQRRADVCFRAFGPLKGFLEDAASSNMFACLCGVLGERGLWPPKGNMLRGAQRMPGRAALLTAQYGLAGEPIWVGGKASPAVW